MKPLEIILIGAVVGGGLLLLTKNAGSTGYAIGAGAVDLVDGVVAGAVTGIGQAVGIPKTNAEIGREALARGDYWEASFYLPAGEFIAGSWNRLFN